MTNLELEVLGFVARYGVVLSDHVAQRVVETNLAALLAKDPSAEAVLKRLVLKGYLTARPVVVTIQEVHRTGKLGKVLDNRYWTHRYSVSDKASTELNLPLPPTIREKFVTHHVKTMEAIWAVEDELGREGGKLVSYKAESELVQEQFQGKLFRAHERPELLLSHFPDAQIGVEHADGRTETVNIEYVSSKYTDAMIRQKARHFVGRTVWAAPNAATAARVRSVTAQEPLLV